MKYLFFALLFSLPAFATEVVQWENIPLPVALHVGQERIVDVGKAVRIGYPATLEGKVRLQSAGGKVFLLANTAFPSTRIQLRDTGSGELILLDIQAIQSTSPLEPVQISYAPQTPATAKASVPVTASTEPCPFCWCAMPRRICMRRCAPSKPCPASRLPRPAGETHHHLTAAAACYRHPAGVMAD
jgi:integrating conjugative element protein (TIGR03749 family)